jgi:hypothetical protein
MKSNQDNDDLGLYSDEVTEQKEEEPEKIYEAEIKAGNAVQYVASIMKVLCLKEPQKGKEFFTNLEEDNPHIMSIIKKNEAEFKRLLYSAKTDEDEKIYKMFFKGQLK